MKIKEMLENIKKEFPYIGTEIQEEKQARIYVCNDKFLNILTYLRNEKFEHLANIFAIDWIDEKEFEINYNLWSYEYLVSIIVKVRIPRDKAKIPTALNIWDHAQIYEREVHEFFGIEFIGNPDLSPLFLHNWKDLPPMRKDFDTEAFSRKAFDVGEREGEK
ncbi:NADH-quinone oxidoreductase subunit C [bacterium]|nr:NADH-quinone oxidoreductase subunit C [bacterium]